MTKRIFLTVFLACFFVSLAFGWGGEQVPSYWKTWIVSNTSGVYSLTNVSNNIIAKGNVLLGYQVMPIPNGKNSEIVCTIYDGGVSSSDEILGEAEAVNNSKAGDWYSRPRVIEKQIYVHQGPNTQVMLFFE